MLRLLALFAVLLMPLGMARPAQAHASMNMTMTQCPEQGGHHKSKGALVECTMACASALPAFQRVADNPPRVAAMPVDAPVQVTLHGLHPDPATPPPKVA